jgi:hypothetical protein
MIEAIRTYQGYTRPEGRIKQSFAVMYRCTNCELITVTLPEIRKHECTGKRKHIQDTKGATPVSD